MYHTVDYNLSAAAAGATNSDATFVTDTELRGQNSHMILTTDFRLWGIALVGASITRGRWQIPKWNFFGEPTLFQANRSLQPPSNPQWDWWGLHGPMLPKNQEIQVQLSNNLGAATEIENAIIQLGRVNGDYNTEQGLFQFVTRATVTVTPTLNAWSGAQSLTMAQSLLGGTYALNGVAVQGSNSAAWRMIFPRNRLYNGYRLRPGGLIQNAVGDALSNQVPNAPRSLGRLGYFNTLELPSIEFLGTAAAATTYQVFLWLAYLDEGLDAIDRYTGGYSQMP